MEASYNLCLDFPLSDPPVDRDPVDPQYPSGIYGCEKLIPCHPHNLPPSFFVLKLSNGYE